MHQHAAVIFALLAMIHFHALRVKKISKETEDCVVLLFDVPPHLAETFRFTQGQSLTLKKTVQGEELRRNYSICSSPLDGELKVAIKKVAGGTFSTWANDELKVGDELEVMPPTGRFHTALDATNKKTYVGFAAGSGITPLLSIIKTTLRTEPHSSFTLVYGNRSKGSIIFKEELEALKDKFMQRFRVFHVLSREQTEVPLNTGRIDAEKCRQLFSTVIDLKKCDEFFICGPEEMIFSVRDFLQGNGIAQKNIHFELFTIPGQKSSVKPSTLNTRQDTGPAAQVTVKLDGIAFDFTLPYNGASVLDAALKQGADLPYACKGGVCCTCKAKLLEGSIVMDENWSLEPDEVAAGFILTCQSHPTTERIVVDFDAK